jgi:DNA-binding MarR family transcriptional regulator
METEGLISLHKSTSDHRLVHLEITKEGKALFQKAQNTFETQIANRIRKLEVDERRLLIERLRSLFDLLKNESTSKHAKGLMIGCNRRISK